MTKIVGVKFKPTGKLYYFDPLDFDIKRGMHVMVETSRGMEYGEVMLGIKEVDPSSVVKPLKGVLRIATAEDEARHEEIKLKEKEALAICAEKVESHGLDMKLVEVEYAFDGSKILFYFTADGRVDFRDLVKDLAAVFKTRIELRQIGVRDESKTLGSIGVCGRSLCCSQFLDEFVPVSIKMAKEQGLSLNPSKISGACGRLMCCLKYEQDTYEELIAQSPKQGAEVNTPDGVGTVANVSLLRGRVRVRFNNSNEVTMKDFVVSEVSPYVQGKDSAPKVVQADDMLKDSIDSPPQKKQRPQKPHSKRDNRGAQKQEQKRDKKPAANVIASETAEKENKKKTYRPNRYKGGRKKPKNKENNTSE